MKKYVVSIFCALLTLCLALSLVSCGKKNKGGNENQGGKVPEDVQKVEINLAESSAKINLNETYTIRVNVENAKATFTYTIEDETIVSVTDGVVKGLKAGSTVVKINATADDEAKTTKELTFNVEVIDNREFNISYEANVEGFSKTADKVKVGGTKEFGSAPAIEGHTFLGWAKTKTETTNFITKVENVAEDMTIYAVYKANEYAIHYLANVDGFTKADGKVKHGENFKLSSTAPSIAGYTFKGWSTSLTFTPITTLENVTSDQTVYAIYDLKSYNITFVLDGGTYTGAKTVQHSKTIQLGTPTKDGYKFLGWSLTKDSTSYITELTGSKNITIYANWKEVIVYPDGVYPVTYNLDGGNWPVLYYTVSELIPLFEADFAAASGHSVAVASFDCSHMESSWFGDFAKNKSYFTKWQWLFDAIWEVAGGTDAQKPETCNFDDTWGVRGFYIANINGYFTGTQHKEGVIGTVSANYADPEIQNLITVKNAPKAEEVGPETYKKGVGATLPTPIKAQYVFMGWEDASGATMTNISASQEGELELKAIWQHEVIAENVTISNIPADGLKLYDTLQLEWVVTPDNAVNKKVLFYVVDDEIFTITEDGLVKAKSCGKGKLRVKLESNPDYEEYVEITVWTGDYFDVKYEGESYVAIDGQTKLSAAYVGKDQTRNAVTWTSITETIASVNNEGVVTGLAEGVATIRATYGDLHFDFYVTVLPTEISDAMQLVIDNHNSNAATFYNQGIGDGSPEYYYDVVGSVNQILFDNLKIDRRYYDKLPSGTKNYGTMDRVEFICVHYTGNMKATSDADNNADYFNNLGYDASIHFVTGRTNLSDLTGQDSGWNEDAYYAFAGLSEKYQGWHASTGRNECTWDDTGLTVEAGDPATPVISISANLKYTINGRETKISIPEVPSGYTINGNVLTVGGKDYDVFNQYGIRAKVDGGKYYIARTWWGSQRNPKALCTYGGNTNSIGIESAVDMGSDLYHTWHVTAQLCAKLMVDFNLGIDRVVGHHFFSGKDCPQPLLENNMAIWKEFIQMVQAEYDLLTTYKDATVTAKAVNAEGILRDNGLLVQDADAHCVTYEVTVTVGGKTETITLATCVESYFKFDGKRPMESLQNLGYPVI